MTLLTESMLEKIWEAFMVHPDLNTTTLDATGKQTVTKHVNFLGSIAKHRSMFLEATRGLIKHQRTGSFEHPRS